MEISLKKFGFVLSSREAGREAFAAFQSRLAEVPADERIFINFDGVHTFSPSWADEFLTPLNEKFGSRVYLKESENPSVIATIDLLEKINKFKFKKARASTNLK
ncbi:hypothetical protein A3D72_04520, partial [Candidatus Uhrbacteria bacterium RIFCSPHIGHO2_02_FULL_57_19]